MTSSKDAQIKRHHPHTNMIIHVKENKRERHCGKSAQQAGERVISITFIPLYIKVALTFSN